MNKMEALQLKRNLDLYGVIEKKSSWERVGNFFTRTDYIDENGNESATLMCNGNLIATWNGLRDGWSWRAREYNNLTR